jgi:hypothetical protein
MWMQCSSQYAAIIGINLLAQIHQLHSAIEGVGLVQNHSLDQLLECVNFISNHVDLVGKVMGAMSECITKQDMKITQLA